MRWIRVMFVGAVALGMAGLDGCGGKVVVDAEGLAGTGGTAGSSNGGMGGAGGAGGSGGSVVNSCIEGSCSGTPDGSCDCTGTCDSQEVKVTCFSTGGALSCTCVAAGIIVAKCEGAAGTQGCNLQSGCCAQYFP